MASNVDRFGIPITETVSTITTNSVIGQRKTFAGLTGLEWVFLVISAINIIVTAGMTIARLVIIVTDTAEADLAMQADFVLCILLLVNGCFCAFYVIHGLFLERDFEIFAFMAAMIIVALYCILEYSVNVKGRNNLKLGRLIAISVMAPVNLIIAGVVAWRFGWLEFKIVGASESLQNMYTLVTRFMSLLRFDFQITVSMLILVLESWQLYEKIILGIGIPLTFFWMLFGMILVKKEWMKVVWLFVLIGLLSPGYVVWKIYHVYEVDVPVDQKSSLFIDYTILAAGALAFLIRAIIFYELYCVVNNFGKGLRERAFDNKEASENTSLLRSGTMPRRGLTNIRIVS